MAKKSFWWFLLTVSAAFGSLTVSTIHYVDENYDVFYNGKDESTSRYKRDVEQGDHIILRENQETAKIKDKNSQPTVKRVIYHGIYPSLEIEQPIGQHLSKNHTANLRSSNFRRYESSRSVRSVPREDQDSQNFHVDAANDSNSPEEHRISQKNARVRVVYQAVYPRAMRNSTGPNHYIRALHPANGSNIDFYTRQYVGRKHLKQQSVGSIYQISSSPYNNEDPQSPRDTGDPENRGRVRLVSAAYYNVNGSRDDLRSFSNPPVRKKQSGMQRLVLANEFGTVTPSSVVRSRRDVASNSDEILQKGRVGGRLQNRRSIDFDTIDSKHQALVSRIITQNSKLADESTGYNSQKQSPVTVNAPLVNLALATSGNIDDLDQEDHARHSGSQKPTTQEHVDVKQDVEKQKPTGVTPVKRSRVVSKVNINCPKHPKSCRLRRLRNRRKGRVEVVSKSERRLPTSTKKLRSRPKTIRSGNPSNNVTPTATLKRQRRDTSQSWNWFEQFFLSLGISTAKAVVQHGISNNVDNEVDDSYSGVDKQALNFYATDDSSHSNEIRRSPKLSINDLNANDNNYELPAERPVLIQAPPRKIRCKPPRRYARGKCRPVL